MIYYPQPLSSLSSLLRSFSSSCCAVFVICTFANLMMSQSAQGQTYEIDNDHTSLVFAVSHSGLSYTYGRFNKCFGNITVGENPEGQSFNFAVATNSIDTNNLLRDDHLKGKDFFDVVIFPKIEFQSVEVTNEQNIYTAKGVLKMHGVEKNIALKLTKTGVGVGPQGDTRIGFFSKFAVQRSDFGMDTLPKMIGDQIAITLSFEAVLNEELKVEQKEEEEEEEEGGEEEEPKDKVSDQSPFGADIEDDSDAVGASTGEEIPESGFGILDN